MSETVIAYAVHMSIRGLNRKH